MCSRCERVCAVPTTVGAHTLSGRTAPLLPASALLNSPALVPDEKVRGGRAHLARRELAISSTERGKQTLARSLACLGGGRLSPLPAHELACERSSDSLCPTLTLFRRSTRTKPTPTAGPASSPPSSRFRLIAAALVPPLLRSPTFPSHLSTRQHLKPQPGEPTRPAQPLARSPSSAS